MSDKELLELAARAIGRKIFYNFIGTQSAGTEFDPLNKDGDAFRLFVDLGMQVHVNRDPAGFTAIAVLQSTSIGARSFVEWGEDLDEYAATRRAIVRAAAEIGKAAAK